MSEEEYYIDILQDEEEEDPKGKEEYSWGSETYPSDKSQSTDYYKEEQDSSPYQQEFYAEGYYQDYQAEPPPGVGRRPKEERPWFWIGFLIAVGFSAIVMIIFNFIGTPSMPGLAYVEIILLLACTTLPGLFVRKIGKGILGGMMIFGLQFFTPLIIFYATGQNPYAFFSPYFVFLNALGLIKLGLGDLFSFSFVPIDQQVQEIYNQYAGYATFVWVFDLLIMFGIMIVLVIASSWLFSNLFTDKAKNFWTWCLLPGQALFIIANLFIVPYILLSMSSTVQIGGALAAGGANIAEIAMPFASGNSSGLEDLDTAAILERIDRADFWFDIAQDNYEGLNNLQFLRLITAASGRYDFVPIIFNKTIYAGFELLAAIQPLAHGFFDNANDSDVEVDGFYFQYGEFMEVYDVFGEMFTANATKPSESNLTAAENQVGAIINDVDYLIDEYFVEVFEHVLNAEAILNTIDPEELRDVGGNAQVEEVLNQVADQLDMVMNISREYRVLAPLLLDIIQESPHLLKGMFNMLVGNVRLILGYQFEQSQQYLTNASDEFAIVKDLFTSTRRSEVSTSDTALGFFDFANDSLSLFSPIIAEEGYLAGTVNGIVKALDAFTYVNGTGDTDVDLSLVDFDQVFANMSYAISNSTAAIDAGYTARNMLNLMSSRANNSDYAIMSQPAAQLVTTIDEAFQPYLFALVIDDMTKAINATYASFYYSTINDGSNFSNELTDAETYIDDALDITNANNGTPIAAIGGFLVFYKDAISSINQIIIDNPALPLNDPFIQDAFADIILTLHSSVHALIDEGLPP